MEKKTKKSGLFITFEGIDGSGKTTQLKLLASRLQGLGIEVVCTKEPGGTVVGQKMRQLLLEEEMSPLAETFLFFADRVEHINQVIAPALEAGKWVLCDRFTDSTYAYQSGGHGLKPGVVDLLETDTGGISQPDLTFLLDIEPEEALKRVAAMRIADRFERENLDFFRRVRQAYLQRAERDRKRFRVINATKNIKEMAQEIEKTVCVLTLGRNLVKSLVMISYEARNSVQMSGNR